MEKIKDLEIQAEIKVVLVKRNNWIGINDCFHSM
jgi:hypothetical protein